MQEKISEKNWLKWTSGLPGCQVKWVQPVYVAVPVSSVLHILFIILASKPPNLCREVSHESLYQIQRGTDPQSQKTAIFYTPSCQT